MKRIAFIMSVMAALVMSCGQSSEKKTAESDKAVVNDVKEETNEITPIKMELKEDNMEMKTIEQPEFDIVTTHGTMRIRLYDKTPLHRDNFVKLVSEKYYDGIRFHRVIEGFMIQTGDPFSRDTTLINKWGQGGPDYTIPAEFVSEYWHKKGALAAARKGDMANPTKASSGSQFYIVHDENACLHLDGQYSIFGEVIDGLNIIDKIAIVPTDMYDRPYEDVIIKTIKPVIVEPEVPEVADTTMVADTTKTE
jgi:cyclophilin family peptidyl-prolyl cis-trans isomerase